MRKAVITSLVSSLICLSSITSAAQHEYTIEEWHLFLEWLRKSHAVYVEGDERPYRYFSQNLMFPEYERKQEVSTASYSGIGFSGDIYAGFPKAVNSKNFGESAIGHYSIKLQLHTLTRKQFYMFLKSVCCLRH